MNAAVNACTAGSGGLYNVAAAAAAKEILEEHVSPPVEEVSRPHECEMDIVALNLKYARVNV